MNKKIAVAGTGYVGLSIATLLAQHNHVTAVDIVPEKVDLINNKRSPIQDDYIEKYLAAKELDLYATLDGEAAYRDVALPLIKKLCGIKNHITSNPAPKYRNNPCPPIFKLNKGINDNIKQGRTGRKATCG